MLTRFISPRTRKPTDFVRDAAVRAAEDVLMETAPIRMSPSGFKAFMAALSGPAAPVPEMVEVFKRTAPWENKASSDEADAGSREEKASKKEIRSGKRR
ncbi:uncharacterized protein (DUF1778 family) [Bradyrhizobium sp. USDA 4354]